MKRILGMVVGVVWLVFTFAAFERARTGWELGQSDVGFWWSVIASLLGIAAVSAFVGTWLHTRAEEG